MSSPIPPPNPDHKRQVIWQIWLPLVLTILIFLGLGGLAISLTTRNHPVAGQWAALSVIIVILPTCLGGIFSLILLSFGIYITGKGVRGLPGITYKIQRIFRQLSTLILYYSNRLASPLISIKSRWAGIQSIFRPKNKPDHSH